jgi:hypothetical protein
MPTNRSATRLDLDQGKEGQKALAGRESPRGWPADSPLDSPLIHRWFTADSLLQFSYARFQIRQTIMYGLDLAKDPINNANGVRLGNVTGE